MLTAIKRRQEREDEGFTLIELMVVVLIIAILLAIAIPTFLGARNSANARAAQSNLRNALTAEQTYWTNNQTFTNDASSIEPSIKWITATSVDSTSGSNAVIAAVSGTNNSEVVLTALGKDGKCWSIAQINDPAATTIPDGTYYSQTGATSSACSTPATLPAGPATAGSAASSSTGGWYTSF